MNRTLVTGGCGFVGRHLTDRLLELGHEIWIIDDLSTGLHPDRWLGPRAESRSERNGQLVYRIHGQSVVFILEDLSAVMMAQLGLLRSAVAHELPAFDYLFALASVVGGRTKIDGDPIGGPDCPEFTLRHVECTRFPKDMPWHNPYGVWRLGNVEDENGA